MTAKEIKEQVYQVINQLKIKDDREYVYRELRKYPTEFWLRIIKGYVEKWRQGVDEEKVSYRKQNAGRKKANIWLRETKHWE